MTGSASAQALRPGRLDGFDPRARVLVVFPGALAVVSLHDLRVLLLALMLAVALALAGGLPTRTLLGRLAALEAFMLVVLVTLPFATPGEPIWQAGGLTLTRDGLEAALAILLRANAVVLLLAGVLGSMSSPALGHALARLGAPHKLVHLMLFTVRYIEVMERELGRARTALRARGFVARADRHGWRTLGWLVGMTLVRSHDRAQRVLAAMKCRGFTGSLYLLDDMRWRGADTGLVAGAGAMAVSLVVLEHLA